MSIEAAARRWSNRRAVSPLLEADDAVLAEMGLWPADVRRALREPIFRDPSRASIACCVADAVAKAEGKSGRGCRTAA
jgi:uncharacterized protein YjiS (DUF1127 family)